MRTTITFPDDQLEQIDRMSERVGLGGRAATIRYLVTKGLESSMVSGALVDQADALKMLVRDMPGMELKDPAAGGVPVTPPQRDKNVRPRKGRVGKRSPGKGRAWP